jgi:hypothetical protein
MSVAKMLLRLSLVIVLIAGVIGVTRSTPARAWVVTDEWGQTGPHTMIDTHSNGGTGVVCRNDLTTSPATVAIEVKEVLLSSAKPDIAQSTSVRYLLYQELPNGSRDLLGQSPLETKSIEASGWASFGPYVFTGRALGPLYIVVVEMSWYDAQGSVSGRLRARVSNYAVETLRPGETFANNRTIQTYCRSPLPPSVSTSATRGVVQSTLRYSLRYFPSDVTVAVRWDGKSLGTVKTTSSGEAFGSLRIPAAPLGNHEIRWTTGTWSDAASFTIVPRIRVIEGTVKRGQTVNISLRGFAARETVRIRWKKGTSWVEIGRVTTSSTGSANVYLKVPTWAKDGPASVRGDGTYGRAQTNAVMVSGGPYTSSTVKATPSPAPTKTPSPTATPRSVPATATASATSPAPTDSPASIPTEFATATATPTAVVETSTPEPSPTATDEPTETVVPVATETVQPEG